VEQRNTTGVLAQGPTLAELSAWIGGVLDSWEAWMTSRDSEWLLWPTENERFPTIGHYFVHAVSPMHRYCDQLDGHDPADDSHINVHSWIAVSTWARQCQQRHHATCLALEPRIASTVVQFQTRSAGPLAVSAGEALLHAMTHCYWHLGGISHMLRLGHVAPPGHGDFIFWAASKHMDAAETGIEHANLLSPEAVEPEMPEVG
jgi:uncharacterized damage-inducible protein DinB